MTRLIAIAFILSACVGCSRERAAASDADGPAPSAAAGTIVIPAGSPMLKQIKRALVESAALPLNEVTAPGKIQANPNRISKVVLPVTGRIKTVLVKAGDAVASGQPLLTIESPDADAAMSTFLSAQAAVNQSQAALTKAQADADRATDLFEHDAVAKKDVMAADTALAQSRASLEQAQAGLAQARRHLAVFGLAPGDVTPEVTLRSPLAGKVLELSVVAGEFRNDTSASVMTIADLRTVWVTAQVPESDIRFVQVGERLEITLLAYPGETFDGRVARIADTVDPQTRTVQVQAEMDNRTGRFRPEMYGSIHHIGKTGQMAVVPATAVVQTGDRTIVFVEDAPGHFVERDVSLGKRTGNLVSVASGVKPGESIVVEGVMLLKGLL